MPEKGESSKLSKQNESEMIFKKKLDWNQVLNRTPEETIAFDENGNYDIKKYPEFHDWMING